LCPPIAWPVDAKRNNGDSVSRNEERKEIIRIGRTRALPSHELTNRLNRNLALSSVSRTFPPEHPTQLVRFSSAATPHGVGMLRQSSVIPLAGPSQALSDLLERDDPASAAKALVQAGAARLELADVRLLAPIDRQEVWAAGVTYIRSRKARMDESVDAST